MARGVVYNVGDGQFQQEDGRPGLYFFTSQMHILRRNLLIPEWAAIIDYEKLVLDSDTSGLASRVSAIETALEDGILLVDGDETQILIKKNDNCRDLMHFFLRLFLRANSGFALIVVR